MWSSDVVARRVAACTRSFPWNRAVESVVRTGDQGLRVSRDERGTERIAWTTAAWRTAAWAIDGRENARPCASGRTLTRAGPGFTGGSQKKRRPGGRRFRKPGSAPGCLLVAVGPDGQGIGRLAQDVALDLARPAGHRE